MSKPTLGPRIRHYREAKGLSLSEAAREIGCGKTYLWKLENGQYSNPSLKILVAICTAFSIGLQTLLKGLVP